MSIKFSVSAFLILVVFLTFHSLLVLHYSSGQLFPDFNISLPQVNNNDTNVQSGLENNNTLALFQPSENITGNQQTGNVTGTAESDLRVYTNRPFGISISYPANWTASPSNLADYTQLISLYSPLQNITDFFPARLTISAIRYVDNVSFPEYTNLTMKLLHHSQAFDIRDSSEVTLGGYPAQRVTLSSKAMPNGTVQINSMQVWTVLGNKVFFVTYDGEASKFNTHFPEVARMIQSVRFID